VQRLNLSRDTTQGRRNFAKYHTMKTDKGSLFLMTGFSTMLTELASVNWEFMDHLTGTVLHITGILSFIIGLFIKWGDIKNKIMQFFKK